MIHVHFSEDCPRRWCHRDSTSVAGRCWLEGRWRQDADLAGRLDAAIRAGRLAADLRSGSGFFALVSQGEGALQAAVDHVRGIPLFYACQGSHFYLSDDAEWVRKHAGCVAPDPMAVAEFMSLGYVTGPDTLFAAVKQLQAGELLTVRELAGRLDVKTERYYRYAPQGSLRESAENLLDPLDSAMRTGFERLTAFLGGRPVALALSSGYDSRLIALWLRRCGYDNVTCFSYGVPGNEESSVSEIIARRLGFRWVFAPYDAKMWHTLFHGPEYQAYSRFAGNLAALPHLQDWPAVSILSGNGQLAPDSVLMAGHSFTASPYFSFSDLPEPTDTDIVEAVVASHYNLRPAGAVPAETWDRLRKRIRMAIGGLAVTSVESALSAFESWEWQERQAKYIINSVRVYEFFGYDWFLPLLDTAIVSFWEDVPWAERNRDHLYAAYATRESARAGIPTPPQRPARKLVRLSLKKAGLLAAVRYFRSRLLLANHPLAMSGIIPAGLAARYRWDTSPALSYAIRAYLEQTAGC